MHNKRSITVHMTIKQAATISKYHTCLLILVDAPLATALRQHGIPFLLH